MRRRLVVASDLHLGGRPDSIGTIGQRVAGTALASSAEPFARFVDWLAARQASDPADVIELVINGDIFDFLCELEAFVEPTRQRWWGDEVLAMRIAAHLEAQFGGEDGPLAALRRFVAQGGELTLLIGNHDVELSYPQVRDWLRQKLEFGRNKLNFIYDGEAYTVGDVLIEHGNRYDPWNVIDHDAMRQDRSLMSRRSLGPEQSPRFAPPAGSHMVVHVLNVLKKQYRFVDLLKPETELVLPLLLTVCPPAIGILRSLVGACTSMGARLATTRGVASGAAHRAGYLSAPDGVGLDSAVISALGSDSRVFAAEIDALQTLGAGQLSSGSDVLQALARQAREFAASADRLVTLATLLAPAQRDTTLSRLQVALAKLNRSDPFALQEEAQPYLSAAERIAAAGFNVVLFGHTHLPKEMRLPSGATYINTGTWADVLRIPAAALRHDSAGREELDHFATKLAVNDYESFAFRRLTYAEVEVTGERPSRASLFEFKSGDHPRERLAGASP